jgi:hypothetical protein
VIDLFSLLTAVYARLYADAQGAAVRALLGAGADSVLVAEDLRIEGLTVLSLPARPLVALRRGAVPIDGRVVNRPVYTWYVYDDPSAGYGRIEALLQPLAQVYEGTPLFVSTVAVGDVEVSAGAQLRDDALKLLLCPVTVIIGAI